MAFDVDKVIADVLAALNTVLNKDIKTSVAFADNQIKSLAKQAAWIAEETATGHLSPADRDWFLEDLAKLTKTFAQVVASLTILTIEKAWNAVVGVIWGAINAFITTAIGGITLPLPKLG